MGGARADVTIINAITCVIGAKGSIQVKNTGIHAKKKKENTHNVKKIKSATFEGPFLRSRRLES